ncbi:MAG TPA: trypsin-like serine protease [Gaiellaceae bacterium]|nr:trypsin-like serine protease [Gaiellaceae bacterium]
MGARRLAACIVLLALTAGVSGGGASAVVGGRAISVRSAPWVVSLRDDFGGGELFNCSGVILDSTHVLTAAHCLFNSSGLLVRLPQVTVSAGLSNFRRAWRQDHPQVRKVASVRFLAGYVWTPDDRPIRRLGADVAVVRLDRPLNLSGTEVRAVALPPDGAPRPSGTGFLLAGFGREHATRESSSALNEMSSGLVRFPNCSSTRTLCGISLTSSSCSGDSGAGLVVPGATPTLDGILVTGTCMRGLISSYVDVAAKPVLGFVEGSGGVSRPPEPPATRWVPPGWMGHRALGDKNTALPFVLSLPRSWIPGSTASGMENLWNPPTRAEVNTSVIGHYKSRTNFFTSILASAKEKYLGQDARAVLRSRIVKLPAGRALELIAHVTLKVDGRRSLLWVENYNLFRNGVGYDIEYQGHPPYDGIDIPVWQRSARTIRFVPVGRNR